MRMTRTLAAIVLAWLSVTALTAPPALAEANTVRISYQFGLGFFPITVVIEHKLIEKYAKAAGLGDVSVSGLQISGAATTNDALLSGSIDVASGGVGGVLQLWDKTKGKVRGLVSVNDMAFLLNTNDPSVKTLKDYLTVENHKIALPAVKIGAHAIVLQMAAAQAFGSDKQEILDKLTMSLPHPDAYAALRGGRSEIKSHFASLPFSYQEIHLKEPKIHTVISSYDIFGGPHNNTMLYTAEKWQNENPKLAKAVFDAFVEAEAWIQANPRDAAALFKRVNKTPMELADLETILTDKKLMGYGPEPLATMKYAAFLHKAGRIKTMPNSWKDYFWPLAHGLNGN